MITFGSVCSGIEAASVAWRPLGWRAAWLAEIEPFPAAVLAHHYPDVPNLGDMTQLAAMIRAGDIQAPDVFCGGTPCQAFSVAGLRRSLDDHRGNLSLTFCEIADAVDAARHVRGEQPCVVFWENVPGVLSTKDNAFGCFLAGLAGEDDPLQPPGGKWSNAGAVYGPRRAVAWRVLDAQYFGVAQRRRRVFVVASAREGFDPAAVLFEFDGVRRDSAPRREAGEEAAAGTGERAAISSGQGWWSESDVGATLRAQDSVTKADTLVPVAYGGNNQSGPIDVATARNACSSASGRLDFESETFLLQPAHTLRGEGFDASEDGTGRGTPLVPVIGWDNDLNASIEQIGTLLKGGDGGRHEGVMVPAIAFDSRQDPVSSEHLFGALGSSSPQAQAVAFQTRGSNLDVGDISGTIGTNADRASGSAPMAQQGMQVRRLTPTECERLQGFPDGYTQIPNWNGWRAMDANETPEQCLAEGLEVRQNKKTGKWRVKDVDGPRYKALGNSWAVPNVRLIGARIQGALMGACHCLEVN